MSSVEAGWILFCQEPHSSGLFLLSFLLNPDMSKIQKLGHALSKHLWVPFLLPPASPISYHVAALTELKVVSGSFKDAAACSA